MKIACFAAVLCLLAGCGGGPSVAPVAKEEAPKSAKILQFYSNTPTVARGQRVLICYGVENAKSVRLDPPVEHIKPSFVRCFPHAPAASADYKLIATGADGKEVSKTIRIEVGGAAAPAAGGGLIVSFAASAKSVPAGREVTLCYDTRNASAVKIAPESSGRNLPVKGCVSEKVPKTTTFTLTALSADGKQDQESLTVAVQP